MYANYYDLLCRHIILDLSDKVTKVIINTYLKPYRFKIFIKVLERIKHLQFMNYKFIKRNN